MNIGDVLIWRLLKNTMDYCLEPRWDNGMGWIIPPEITTKLDKISNCFQASGDQAMKDSDSPEMGTTWDGRMITLDYCLESFQSVMQEGDPRRIPWVCKGEDGTGESCIERELWESWRFLLSTQKNTYQCMHVSKLPEAGERTTWVYWGGGVHNTLYSDRGGIIPDPSSLTGKSDSSQGTGVEYIALGPT